MDVQGRVRLRFVWTDLKEGSNFDYGATKKGAKVKAEMSIFGPRLASAVGMSRPSASAARASASAGRRAPRLRPVAAALGPQVLLAPRAGTPRGRDAPLQQPRGHLAPLSARGRRPALLPCPFECTIQPVLFFFFSRWCFPSGTWCGRRWYLPRRSQLSSTRGRMRVRRRCVAVCASNRQRRSAHLLIEVVAAILAAPGPILR